MASNKERIEALEAGLGGVQDGMLRMELGVTDKLHHLEETINKLSEAFLSTREASSNTNHGREGSFRSHREETDGGRQIFSSKMAKMEFPKYSGDDPTEWFSKVAQFFEFQGTTNNQKVTLAAFHLEGEANQWWQWLRRTYQEEGRLVTWESFEEELWARFGPPECEDFDEALSRVRQVGSLRDYQREFERLGNRVQGWTQKALVGTFMGGLKSEIADGIRMFKPKTLKEAISLARMRDEQIARTKRFTRPPLLNRVPTTTTPLNRATPTTPKRLSWDEMQKRRAQGLCFNCNDKFTPGHKCQGSQLLLLECQTSNQTTEYAVEDEELQMTDTLDDQHDPEISFHALTGWTSPRTMRVAATIGSQTVMVLIDSGSTHNFLSEKVARLLRLSVVPTNSFAVRVANGERLICQGRFDEVQVNLQGIIFSLTLYSLPLAGLDMVLGIQWLEMLGSVVCNWKQLTMDFRWDNQAQRLQGINQAIQATSLASVAKDMRQGHMMFAIYLQPAEQSTWAATNPNMQQTMTDYADVFKAPTTLPPLRDIDHHIPLKDGTQPINVRPYRYAYFQKAEIEKQVQEMLNMGVIRPSTSPFSSPVLLVKKKDGTWRFCTDYRALNAATIKDRFPIPTVDDMLDELYGAAYFTKLDLRAGYHQVRVHAPDIPKTAFRTHNGHFEYLVMPFGLCNAPSTFQAIMNSIFHSHLRKFILVFFDDILVYSPTWETHIEHVRTTLDILRQHQFFIKESKCDFGKQELEYLGHIVTHQGVKVDNKKIEAMVSWPQPANITDLRGFLGLTGYYRKFVRSYGLLARPLTNLLKKGSFRWTDEAAGAFELLKQAMTTTPTLAMPNFNDSFIVETDASGDGIGAVLTQQGQPIAFMSRALGLSKRAWSIYAKEMLAIVEAIRTWRPYLLGKKFFIRTDHRSLKYFLDQRVATPEQQKWVAKLLGYDYEILYRPGRENSAADALSRRPDSPLLNPLFVSQVTLWDDMRSAAQDDPYLQQVSRQSTTAPTGPYSVQNGLYFYKKRVIVPQALRNQLLQEFHDSKMAGHSGVLRTFKRLAQQFYWPSMYRSVQDYISQCEVCQRTKTETLAPAGLLQPLPIPCHVWDDISLDFIEGLPSSHGKNSLLVVVDRLSKYAHFIALSHPFSAKIVAATFVEHIIKLHGMPKSIITDRDPIFISKFWQEFFTMSGTKLKLSSAYHPQTDGQTEVVNRCVEQYLRCFVHQWPRKWLSYLPWAEFWYNTTYHSSTGMTPFQALYGRLPPSIPLYLDGLSRVNEVDQSLLQRDDLLQHLKKNLDMAANRMKQTADKKRRNVEFQAGDMVLLKLHPYRQQTAFKRVHQKLASKFYGPYQIEKKIGNVAYQLHLPASAKIHPVFHVSLLKKYVGGPPQVTLDLPPITDEGVASVEPEQILDTRWFKQGDKFVEESLVKWKQLPTEDATWEDTTLLHNQFPYLDLEDKDPIGEGSNVRPRRSARTPMKNPKYLA
ncbi:hypothetical protein UlMin_028402 [Ulmus minor]